MLLFQGNNKNITHDSLKLLLETSDIRLSKDEQSKSQNHRNRLNKARIERRMGQTVGNGRAAFVSSGLSAVNLILILILSRPGSRVYWVDFDLNPLERRDNTRTRGWNSAAGILLINFIASSRVMKHYTLAELRYASFRILFKFKRIIDIAFFHRCVSKISNVNPAKLRG